MPKIWYAEKGLKFECQGCGGCCEGPGGYVWVNEEEIKALAVAKQMTEEAFCKRYVRIVFDHPALIDNARGDCIFLEEKRCAVYESRPRQCRTFPWWPELLRSENAWKNNNYSCPGMNKGKNHSAEEIIAICGQNKEK